MHLIVVSYICTLQSNVSFHTLSQLQKRLWHWQDKDEKYIFHVHSCIHNAVHNYFVTLQSVEVQYFAVFKTNKKRSSHLSLTLEIIHFFRTPLSTFTIVPHLCIIFSSFAPSLSAETTAEC